MSLNWSLSDLSCDQIKVTHFWQENQRSVCHSPCNILGGTWCHFSLIISDNNSDHLPSFVTVRFLFFPLNKLSHKDMLRLFHFSNFYPPVLVFIDNSYWKQFVLLGLPNGDFLIPPFLRYSLAFCSKKTLTLCPVY